MVTYSIRESTDGTWRVCRSSFALFRGLRLADAIQLAHEAARDEFRRSGRGTIVDMPGPGSLQPIRLACYALTDALPSSENEAG